MIIKVDLAQMTLDELELIYENQDSFSSKPSIKDRLLGRKRGQFSDIKTFVAMFIRNDDGSAMSDSEALKAAGTLTVTQLGEVMTALNTAVGEVAKSAVPPKTR